MTRWPLLVVVLFVALAIDASLGHVLRIGDVTPRFVPIVVVFVALFASRSAVLWSAWAAGLMVDLLTDLPHGADDVGPLIGPHALGYVFGAIVVMQFRPVLLRRHVLTVLAMTFAFLVGSSLVTVFMYAAHGWYEAQPLFWSDHGPLRELWRRILATAYTTGIALVVGPVLLLSLPAWGFRAGNYPGAPRR